MTYCIVENGIVSNIIVCDAAFAAEIGAMPYYSDAAIGEEYTPYQSKKQLKRIDDLESENKALKEQLAGMDDTMVELYEMQGGGE